MTSDEMVALFARRREGLGCHDASMLAADYADDCVLESPSWGRVQGRISVEKVFREFFTAFPDCVFEFGELLIVANRAAEIVTIQGTNSGGFFGQAPTGRPFSRERRPSMR
jgi:predicted ester cyclase